MSFPTLFTERLMIRRFEMEDLDTIHRIFEHDIPQWENLTLDQRRDWRTRPS